MTLNKRQNDYFGPKPAMTTRDWKLVAAIVDRANFIFPDRLKRDIMLDIVCVHLGPCRLRLQDWLEADSFNFIHDVIGIERHLDRTTFKLCDCFVPRFADVEKKNVGGGGGCSGQSQLSREEE